MYILRQLIKFNSDHIYRFYKNPGTIETLIEFICKENDFKAVGNLIADVLDGLKQFEDNTKIEKEVYVKVMEITKKFAIYE